MPAGGGEATEVTHDGGELWVRVSRSAVALLCQEHQRSVRPVEFAPVRAETRVLENLSYPFNSVGRSKASLRLPAAPNSGPGRLGRWSTLDFATGKIKLLLRKVPFGLGLTISPDGRSLLYSHRRLRRRPIWKTFAEDSMRVRAWQRIRECRLCRRSARRSTTCATIQPPVIAATVVQLTGW